MLSGLKWYSCLVYIDDIVVVGDSFENHLYNLVGVLKWLREAGLKVKPSSVVCVKKKSSILDMWFQQKGFLQTQLK